MQKPKLYIFSKDKGYIKDIKSTISDSFRIKNLIRESDITADNIKTEDLFIFDISSFYENIPESIYRLNAFKILVYNKFFPDNINEILPDFDFYISKSIPMNDLLEKLIRIKENISKGFNPITYMPGNTDFENEYIAKKTGDMAVAFIDIDNFKYFHMAKGTTRSEKLLRILSTIIRKNIFTSSVKKTATAYNIFIDRFAIIAERDELMRICSFIYEDFSRYKNILFDNSELTRQFFVMQDRTGNIYDIPITSITTILITRFFDSIVDLYRTADDIFTYLKSKGGNLIFSDRRQQINTLPESGTILIAVYDQMKSNYLKISLERLGWKIFVTNDGITALKLYNRVRPSIIILDEELPLINYKDIINVLRYELSDNRTIIVLLSEIDEWINSQYKFSTLSKDLNAEKLNQKFMALMSHNSNEKG